MGQREPTFDFYQPAALDGSTAWHAKHCGRDWTVYHEALAVCLCGPALTDGVYRGKHWQTGPGSLAVFEPGEVHRSYNQTNPCDFWVVHLPSESVNRWTGGRPPHFPRMVYEDPALVALLRRAFETVARGAETLAQESAWTEFLSELIGAHAEMPSRPPPPLGRQLLSRVRDLIESDLSAKYTLEDLAEAAGMKRFTFARAFRQECHMSPYAFVLERRVSRAKALLRSGTPCVEAALLAGFTDQSHLHRHFRRLVGVTPGAYARAFMS